MLHANVEFTSIATRVPCPLKARQNTTRKVSRVLRCKIRFVDIRNLAQSDEHVPNQSKMEHFLHNNLADEVIHLNVASITDGVEGGEVGRNGGPLQLKCRLQLLH
jgi:hypothetical protein